MVATKTPPKPKEPSNRSSQSTTASAQANPQTNNNNNSNNDVNNDKRKAKTASSNSSSTTTSRKYQIPIPEFDSMNPEQQQQQSQNFPDDAPFWEVAKSSISTQPTTKHNSDDGNDENETEDASTNNTKQRQKEETKRSQREQLKKDYQQTMDSMKTPNFKLGPQNNQENDFDDDNDDGDDTNYEYRKVTNKRNEFRPSVFSPSELSKVSTIPPTPMTVDSKNTKSQSMSGYHKDGEDDMDQDDDSVELGLNARDSNSHFKDNSNDGDDDDDDLLPTTAADEETYTSLFRRKGSNDSSFDNAAMLLPTDASPPISPELENSMEELLNNTLTDNDDDDDDNRDVLKQQKNGNGSLNMSNLSPIQEQGGVEDNNDFYQNDNDDYDDDDHDEGVGFQLNSPTTTKNPTSSTSVPKQSNEDSMENDTSPIIDPKSKSSMKRSKKTKPLNKDKLREDADVSSEDDDQQPKKSNQKKSTKSKPKKRVSYAPTFSSKGYQVANRDYERIDINNDDDNDDENLEGVRRSRRQKFKPLEFWRNECLVYEAHHETGVLGRAMGDMPVVTGVMKALPTPYKKRKLPVRKDGDDDEDGGKKKKKKGKDLKSKMSGGSTSSDSVIPFDSKQLRKKYHIIDEETGAVWNEFANEADEQRIICFQDRLSWAELPHNNRSKGESIIGGKAAQSFHVQSAQDESLTTPGYISGSLKLPPTGIKDPESVGSCSQIFFVLDAQPKALEFALADPEENEGQFSAKVAQRYLLSKGDAFQIPTGNVYRLENHSKTKECVLNWVIIKPLSMLPDAS